MLELQSYWQNSEAVLTYFLRICSVSPTTSKGACLSLFAVSDARHRATFYELSSMVEACSPLFSNLRCRDATFFQLQLSLVGFCKSPCSYIANVQNLHARSLCYLKFFIEKKVPEVCAILVCFVYLNGERSVSHNHTHTCENIFPSVHKGRLASARQSQAQYVYLILSCICIYSGWTVCKFYICMTNVALQTPSPTPSPPSFILPLLPYPSPSSLPLIPYPSPFSLPLIPLPPSLPPYPPILR